MKGVFSVGGLLFLLLGLHWVGQATGYFAWQRNPVMDNEIDWAYCGGVGPRHYPPATTLIEIRTAANRRPHFPAIRAPVAS